MGIDVLGVSATGFKQHLTGPATGRESSTLAAFRLHPVLLLIIVVEPDLFTNSLCIGLSQKDSVNLFGNNQLCVIDSRNTMQSKAQHEH